MHIGPRIKLLDLKKGMSFFEVDRGMVVELVALEDAHKGISHEVKGIVCLSQVVGGQQDGEQVPLFEAADCPSAYRLKLYRREADPAP
jgi:hypothetical protein